MNTAQQSRAAWQRRGDARRLSCADSGQLQQVQCVLQQSEDAWRAAWGVPAAAAVRCEPLVFATAAIEWDVLGQKPGAAVQVRWSGAAQSPLYAPANEPGPLAVAANAACRADRVARLASALLLDGPAWGDREGMVPSGRWSGSVRAVLGCGTELRLDAGAVALLSAARPLRKAALPALVPVLQAAAGRRLRVQARLADCTIELGRLQDLRPGDVVRLEHRLEAPVALHACGEAVFGGFLAARSGRKALELSPAPPSSSQEKATS